MNFAKRRSERRAGESPQVAGRTPFRETLDDAPKLYKRPTAMMARQLPLSESWQKKAATPDWDSGLPPRQG